jgi:hypothetical protein
VNDHWEGTSLKSPEKDLRFQMWAG